MTDRFRVQAWEKKGRIYVPQGAHGFDHSHCHKPTPLLRDENTIRIYFGTRDRSGKTRTTFVDVDAADSGRVIYIHDRPVLDLGKLGAFDDSGANVCSVLRVGSRIYMYFIGWNPGTTVHTRNAIGLAISEDGGWTFSRLFDGAVLDRNRDEPYSTGAVDVMQVNDGFWAWYTSGSEWKIINGKPEIFYHIKRASSTDGRNWQRRDEEVGLDRSLAGWDSEAIAYPYVLNVGKRQLIFYNGNGFGRTGMGWAMRSRGLP